MFQISNSYSWLFFLVALQPKGVSAATIPTCCQDYKDLGQTGGTLYQIDPDGHGGVDPFQVECDFLTTPATDIVPHNMVGRNEVVSGKRYPRGNPYNVSYAPVTLDQIMALMSIDGNCEQQLKYECRHSKITDGRGHMLTRWHGHNGTAQPAWPGGAGFGCFCRLFKSCAKGRDSPCNCDLEDGHWHEDGGVVSDKGLLPITRVDLPPAGRSSWSFMTLGPLRCQAKPPSPPIVNNDGFKCCTAWGDAHFKRFDGYPDLHYQGICLYNFASSDTNDFQILIKLERRYGKPHVSFTRYVEASVAPDTKVRLDKNKVVKVNGVEVTLPYNKEGVEVTRLGNKVLYRVDNKFDLSFDGDSRATICVAPAYEGHMTGLCGNNNGNNYDDNENCDGRVVPNTPDFQKMVGDCNQAADPHDPGCQNESEPPPECPEEQEIHARSRTLCGQLIDARGPFSDCILSSNVDYNQYMSSCVYDWCSTNLLGCDSLEAMEEDCEDKSYPVGDWRIATDCQPKEDMCSRLHWNPKYDRLMVVIKVYVQDEFTCKAVLINRATAVLTDICVPRAEHRSNVYATPENREVHTHRCTLITGPPKGIIHTVKFYGHPTDPHFRAVGRNMTAQEYLQTHGRKNNDFPRLNPGFDASAACIIPSSGPDVDVLRVESYLCEGNGGRAPLRDDQACFRAPYTVAPDTWLGQPLLFVNDDIEETPFLHAFVSRIVWQRYLVVDLVSAVANDIGCQDSIPAYWMDDPEQHINDVELVSSPGCATETWLTQTSPVCGIHPPLCLVPVVKQTTTSNNPSCPANQTLSLDLMKVTCCDDDQPDDCRCHDYGIMYKCPW